MLFYFEIVFLSMHCCSSICRAIQITPVKNVCFELKKKTQSADFSRGEKNPHNCYRTPWYLHTHSIITHLEPKQLIARHRNLHNLVPLLPHNKPIWHTAS